MNVTIYTDGAARGNPGPGGYGAVLEYIDPKNQLHVKELSAGYRRTTNNRMELLGVITALAAMNRNVSIVMNFRHLNSGSGFFRQRHPMQ